MPATEQTWYDMKRMHQIFAASGVVLFLVTLWMFADDHSREWKTYQSEARSIQLQMTKWRERQYQTESALAEHEILQDALRVARSKPLDAELVARFKTLITEDAERRQTAAPSFTTLESQVADVNKLANAAAKIRADLAKLLAAAKKAEDEADRLATEATTLSQTVEGAENPEAVKAEIQKKEEQSAELRKQVAATAKKAEAVEDSLVEAEVAVGEARTAAFKTMQSYIDRAEFREDTASNTRKIQSAKVDAKKAEVGLAVRDHKPTEELQAEVDKMIQNSEDGLNKLTAEFQFASQHREDLEKVFGELREEEAAAEKAMNDNLAELERLEKAYDSERATYVNWIGPELPAVGSVIPWPGKRVLELPILDAFSSPLQIENLWNEELTIDYNFRRNRRFDRCTTCHQMMQKTQPGSAVDPTYLALNTVEFVLQPPAQESLPELKVNPETNEEIPRTLLETYGFELAGGPNSTDGGFVDRSAVTVKFVQPDSPAAKALPADAGHGDQEGIELRRALLQSVGASEAPQATAGLMVGDVIAAIDGDPIVARREAVGALMNRIEIAAQNGVPLRLTIQRGLPHPYSTHPRLDLFVGSLSPHKMSVYGCTICHEGQGSATAFKWASHTPNSNKDMRQWRDEHGWFDNHHWIYPMYPNRYIESTCLKCHHDVTELRPSEDFPEPPAPKVTQGHDVINKYGCYGCHEVNGWDGPNKRIGPDMRLEPNFFAAAQQIKADPAFDDLSAENQTLVRHLIDHPEDNDVRHKLHALLQNDIRLKEHNKEQSESVGEPAEGEETETAQPVLSDKSHQMEALLRDVETPGTLRKSGPSLRFVADKVDAKFLYEWIRNPQNSRPSTRMPRFFGLLDHIEEESQLKRTEQFETVEILAMSSYLLEMSQPFELLKPVVEQGDAARGKQQFQVRGCLACHTHEDPELKDMSNYRPVGEIVQGPDLSNLPSKFDPRRNPKGKAWLYSWIKEPTRYHVRTVMPNLFLDPIKDENGKVVSDPVSDIVEFLLSGASETDEEDPRLAEAPIAIDAQGKAVKLPADKAEWLKDLARTHLEGQFRRLTSAKYLNEGIPADRADSLKGAEIEMVISEEEQAEVQKQIDAGAPADKALATLIEKKRLLYVGRKSIAKYGCYACHDIPGFEGAKSIGTGLADWGRKDSSKLAFEHIAQFLEHHGGHSDGHAKNSEPHAHDEDDSHAHEMAHSDTVVPFGDGTIGELDPYSEHQLLSGHREGFIAQKLRGPRTYDYHKIGNKGYNERLRMPLFPLTAEEREAVITFVIGLVADPPAETFIYKPSPRKQAIQEGERILEKYNCGGCHILELEKWDLKYDPGHFAENASQPASSLKSIYPYLTSRASSAKIEESLETNRQGLRTATITGLPSISGDALPTLFDDEGDPIEDDDEYDPHSLIQSFDLWQPAILDGQVFEPALLPLRITPEMIAKKHSVRGGDLTRYLLPVVTKIEKQSNPAAKGSEAYAWLPPPLVGEGRKVQTEWLHDFLLEPYPIRPATFLRMPKFNMSPEEASKLANYFAAVDNATYPYDFSRRRLDSLLTQKQQQYERKEEAEGSRLAAAMKIVTNNNYCVKCHIVGDFRPQGADRALAPNLAVVFERLRGPYLRDWIARPSAILPYTAMPINVPYDPDAPNLGGVDQSLYHGTSLEQVDGLTDLLMNFDEYTKNQVSISDQAKAAAEAAKPTEEGQDATKDDSPDEPENKTETPSEPADSKTPKEGEAP